MPKYIVRYGAMRLLGIFSVRGKQSMSRGTKVIARTSRGLEAGEVLCEATAEAAEQIKNPDNGQILRQMTTEDRNELEHIRTQSRDEFETCERYVEKLGLDMDLVDVEHVFGGERIVVFYLADERVDFRELVKQLAAEFQTRIEMRQIGVRDESRLLADYGDCGKPVCCNTHLSAMPPVSMKMAKNPESNAGSHEDFRTLRSAEVLSALRVRYVCRHAGRNCRRSVPRLLRQMVVPTS